MWYIHKFQVDSKGQKFDPVRVVPGDIIAKMFLIYILFNSSIHSFIPKHYSRERGRSKSTVKILSSLHYIIAFITVLQAVN